MSTGWFEDKTALLFFTLYIFLWNFSPKPRPREKEPSQSWPTKLGSPFIARVEFPGESLRQVLIYLPNRAVAMRKKSELRQHREHGRKQPKPIKIHQMGFKAYHFVFQCTIRSKSAEIPNVQDFLNCGGFRQCYLDSNLVRQSHRPSRASLVSMWRMLRAPELSWAISGIFDHWAIDMSQISWRKGHHNVKLAQHGRSQDLSIASVTLRISTRFYASDFRPLKLRDHVMTDRLLSCGFWWFCMGRFGEIATHGIKWTQHAQQPNNLEHQLEVHRSTNLASSSTHTTRVTKRK